MGKIENIILKRTIENLEQKLDIIIQRLEKLEMKLNKGTLIVRSKPSNAVVTVGSEKNITPVFFDLDIRDIPYDVKIEKEGYIDYTQKVDIQSDSKIEINAVLKKIKKS